MIKGTFEQRLLRVTQDCSPDMHEPDNQGIKAMVSGYHLDNAMGDDPNHNCGEFTVAIVQDDGTTDWFNLATLISLARIGARVSYNLENPTLRVLHDQVSEKAQKFGKYSPFQISCEDLLDLLDKRGSE